VIPDTRLDHPLSPTARRSGSTGYGRLATMTDQTTPGAASDAASDAASSVLLDVTEGVATVTLNRPEAMNSLDVATKVLLRETLAQVAADDAVRCVVLRGTGRAFCTGQDLKEHVHLLQNGGSEQLFSTVDEHYNPIVTTLVEMDKPVVAAVNGVAAGAGASLAMACDVRVVADTAGFNLAFAGVGLAADTGASIHLPLLVGRTRAMELLYFPRTVPAAEALEIGLASRVVAADDFDAEVAAVASRLAQGPTRAYGAIRRSVAFGATHDFAEAVAFESAMMQRTGATMDHQAAVDSFVAKERPTFRGK